METSATHSLQTYPRRASHQTDNPNFSITIASGNKLNILKNTLLPLKACILSIKERLCFIISLLFSFIQKWRTVDPLPINSNPHVLHNELESDDVYSNENSNTIIHQPEYPPSSQSPLFETADSQTENEKVLKANPLDNDTLPTAENVSHQSTIGNLENNDISPVLDERTISQHHSLHTEHQPEQIVLYGSTIPILNTTDTNRQQCSESENSTHESVSVMQIASRPTIIDYKIAAYHQLMVDLDTLSPLLQKTETNRLLTPYCCQSIVTSFNTLTALLPHTQIFNNLDEINNYLRALIDNNEMQQDSQIIEFITAMNNLNKFIKTACKRKKMHQIDFHTDKTLNILFSQIIRNLDALFSHSMTQQETPNLKTYPTYQHSSPTKRKKTYIKIPKFSRVPPRLNN